MKAASTRSYAPHCADMFVADHSSRSALSRISARTVTPRSPKRAMAWGMGARLIRRILEALGKSYVIVFGKHKIFRRRNSSRG